MPDSNSIPAWQRQRLLIFNLRTDVDDHILGFTTRWINALAPYYDAVDVLTTHAGQLAVADNVRVFSTGREHGANKLLRTLTFYRRLAALLLANHYDACFAHMQPLFAVLGAPLLKLRGIPVTTWYTHRQMSRTIEWAERVSYRIVTAVPSSFPLQTDKVRAIGHGIDTGFFAPDEGVSMAHPPRIVYVARLTEIKGQHMLLHAAKDLDCEIVFVGDIPDGYDDGYKQRLISLVSELGMSGRVIFAGPQTPDQVLMWYRTAAAAINISPPGLFDKAALEAMAVGVPTIVSNAAFAPLLGSYAGLLTIPAPDDITALTDCLQRVLALPTDTRQQIGWQLRAAVIRNHGLEALVLKLIAVMHSGEMIGQYDE